MQTNIFYLIILIILSGFFSGAEIALFSLSQAKVRSLVEQKRKNAKKLQYLKEHSSKLLITILIGNNLVNISAASLATVVAIDVLGSSGAGIAAGVMTFLILVFGEILPKSIAQNNAASLSLKMTPVLILLFYITWPISSLLEILSKLVNKIFKTNKEKNAAEEEVKALVAIGEEEGSLEKDEKEMIHKIFSLNDITAEDVMTVRSEMITFEAKQTLAEVLPIINQTGHSRFPVYQGREDKIEGVILAKDVLEYLATAEDKNIKIKQLAKPAIFVPEQKALDDLLREFQKQRVHIAIVVNEHGEVTGLVTLEDLLEEIVGEIIDETDVDEDIIQRIDKRTIIVDANTEIGHINRFFNVSLEGSEHDSIAHLILEELGEVPQKNDELTINKIKIIIEEAEDRRIKRVKLIKLF